MGLEIERSRGLMAVWRHQAGEIDTSQAAQPTSTKKVLQHYYYIFLNLIALLFEKLTHRKNSNGQNLVLSYQQSC
jgi:hypothetical protein